MASEVPEQSRAREEAAEREATAEVAGQQRRRSWVALASIPVVYDPNHERAAAMAPGVADFLLQLDEQPRVSYLALPERLAPDCRQRWPADNFPFIVAATPDRLLFVVTNKAQRRGGVDPAYFLCDVRAGTATQLPVVPRELGIKLFPRRTVGLVADPRFPGQHMVVQLHPEGTAMTRHDALLCYSTATSQWTVKMLASAPDHEPWGAHGVFAHGGLLLYWVDIAYGMLFCDPFEDHPELRFVPLPDGCEMEGLGRGPRPSKLMDQRRCIRPSQGKLRYVEIQGLSYDRAALDDPPIDPAVSVWTLVNPAGPSHWDFECDAPFSEIWTHQSYISAGLPQDKVPRLALVDPNNYNVVYFFRGASLFAVNVSTREVVACEEFWVDVEFQDVEFQYSRFVDAWELELPSTDPASSSEGGNRMKGSDGEEQLDAATGSDEELASLFSQMEIKSQPDTDRSEGDARSWVALSSVPVVHGPKHELAAAMAPGVGDFMLKLDDQPRVSYLALPERLAPDPRQCDPNSFPYIIAATPDRILFAATDMAQRRCLLDPMFFLCDVHARTATQLPVVPWELGIGLIQRRTVGLVADPRFPGHHMVVQLHPEGTAMTRHDALLCYSTATSQWTVKTLASAPDHEPWGAHGVFAHGGLLYWVDIAYGMLVCDPFDDHPELRFIPLPDGCELQGLGRSRRVTTLMDQRRCIRPSQGKLHYVEIQGLSYDRAALDDPPIDPAVSVWTLVNPAGPNHWDFACDAPFSEIWSHQSYISAGLPLDKVPRLALVDPNNYSVVYFFQGASLFAVNVSTREVVACEEFWVDVEFQDVEFQYSRFVHAWELELPPTDPASLSQGSSSEESEASVDSETKELMALQQQFHEAAARGPTLPCVLCFERRKPPGRFISVKCCMFKDFDDHYRLYHGSFLQRNKTSCVQCDVCGNWLPNFAAYKQHKQDFH